MTKRLAPEWSKTPPKEPGWYWTRCNRDKAAPGTNPVWYPWISPGKVGSTGEAVFTPLDDDCEWWTARILEPEEVPK